MIDTIPIISKGDFVLVPTDKSDIKYIWDILNHWTSCEAWKSMYKSFQDFEDDINYRMDKDLIWTCWTKNGKASKKFGMIMLTNIAYGLSADIHGIADKSYMKESRTSIVDRSFDSVLSYAFNELKVARVNATFYRKDTMLEAFLKRQGFKRNAILKKSCYINGEVADTFIYGLLEDDYLLREK